MASVPRSFNLETAAQDFAGEGREIQCPWLRPEEWAAGMDRGPYSRRQMLLSVNGWTLSAVWGFGTYCTAGRSQGITTDDFPQESPDAEIAVWKGDGPMIELHGDTVEGWVSPASFVAAIEAAERDDEDGIRAALVRTEEEA